MRYLLLMMISNFTFLYFSLRSLTQFTASKFMFKLGIKAGAVYKK